MSVTEMIVAAFLIGLSAGAGLSMAVAEYMARREHKAWIALLDKYEDVIRKLKGGGT